LTDEAVSPSPASWDAAERSFCSLAAFADSIAGHTAPEGTHQCLHRYLARSSVATAWFAIALLSLIQSVTIFVKFRFVADSGGLALAAFGYRRASSPDGGQQQLCGFLGMFQLAPTSGAQPGMKVK
jgi:hypothetical protein